ncbi:hypothetical protein EAY42_25710, partial [Vibrio anguillarum]|nr:hypothetical protein [Vibrio anguillarum]
MFKYHPICNLLHCKLLSFLLVRNMDFYYCFAQLTITNNYQIYMNTLGLRASPSTVYFCIYDSTDDSIINLEQIAIPNVFETPEKLKYLRITILDIIREYEVQKAGIRLSELHPSAKPNVTRIQFEGIIQEAFASSSLQSYFRGTIVTIASLLERRSREIKPLIDGTQTIEHLDEWADYSKEERESILA